MGRRQKSVGRRQMSVGESYGYMHVMDLIRPFLPKQLDTVYAICMTSL